MTLFFCLLFYLFFFLFPRCTAANMRGSIGSSIQDGKFLHEVFLQKGTGPSEVANLIKSTVGHDYISSWSDADDGLVSAQFKATENQIEKVKDHKDIVRTMKVEFPVQDISTPSGRRRFAETKYYIRPINGENVDQCNATGTILKTILEDKVRASMVMDGRFSKWAAEMTDEQVLEVESLDGIKCVRRQHRGRRGRLLPSMVKPPEPSNLRAPEKRDITYETQKAAATELIAISQPRYLNRNVQSISLSADHSLYTVQLQI